jgi:hypothetical protein
MRYQYTIEVETYEPIDFFAYADYMQNVLSDYVPEDILDVSVLQSVLVAAR